MALDYGRRRIGIAISDPGRILASPHAVIEYRGPSGEPPPDLIAMLREIEPAEVLLGIPVNMDGSEGEMAVETRRFGVGITDLLGIPIVERDERLSSLEADRRLRESGLPRAKRRNKGRRDMMAATVILEDYLAES
ncbi:MAG: Holliday junction resolvase RuvX [Gemmatimonadota bacterium]